MVKEQNRRSSHDYNYQRIIAYIFNHRSISRSDIAAALDLNKATVSLLCGEMQQQGLLSEVGSGSASANGGRKPTLLEINKQYGYTITVEIEAQLVRALACYLDGETIAFQQFKLTTTSNLPQELQRLVAKFKDIEDTQHGLLGICFAIHGLVNHNQIQTSFVDLSQVAFMDLFADYQVPIILENEANLAALYSRDFIQTAAQKNTVTLSIHQGISAGLILGDQLYRGSQGRVGKIGTNIVMPAFPINNRRSLVTYQDVYSELAIVRQISELVEKTTLSLDDISKLYDDHNSEVVTVISQFANGVAEMLHNMAGMLDPDVFYLNSPLLHQVPSALGQIRRYFKRLSGYDISIQLMPNIQLATLLGGAALLTHRALGLDGQTLNLWEYSND